MADRQFKDGDVVQLKSGGPKMTVMGYDVYGLGETEKTYKCRWFDEKNKPAEEYFPEAALKVADATAPRSRHTYIATSKGL